MTSSLSQAFHGVASGDEANAIPGSGGNLNSVYDGWGSMTLPQPGFDLGYEVGRFPAGRLPSGAEMQEFRISDSSAFNNLRGIAKTSHPFTPQAVTDTPDQQASSLVDNFQQPDVAGVSSLLPGRFSYTNQKHSLSKQILQEFEAGTSTYNSLSNAASGWAVENEDGLRGSSSVSGQLAEFAVSNAGVNGQVQEGISAQTVEDQFREAFAAPAEQDVPLTPFHKTYPNFGAGKVDYGFNEPGADAMSEEIIRAYHAVLPEGQLAGTKQELMPVFSGVNQAAVDQRPILQSLGKTKGTLWLGGVIELPDELKISPEQALLSGSFIPTGIEQTAGELASALDIMGFNPSANGLNSGSAYGAVLPSSRTLAGGEVQADPAFYAHQTYMSNEPLVFGGSGYEYTSSEPAIQGQ
jgi:hypothetical protein